MIDKDQKQLAEFVKLVHLSLRHRAREIGAENAWVEHLKNEQVLRQYASSMKKLAVNYWLPNNRKYANAIQCRIEWMVNCITEYFQKDGFQKELKKEQSKVNLLFKKQLVGAEELKLINNNIFKSAPLVPFKMLDVGSCYNPFKAFSCLDVYPIDLYPENPDVKKGNFITIEVCDIETRPWFFDNLFQIPSNFFDAVVFSLYLEYLPSPKQRYNSFVKAYKCLKPNGLLLIATPDSKHASANALIMKKWKLAAAYIGFIRIRLEKLRHLYCMAFRKCISRNYPVLINNVDIDNCEPENMITIPQDFNEHKSDQKLEEVCLDKLNTKKMFDQLPFCDEFLKNKNVEADY